MIIDWHTHVHPPKEAARPFWQGRCPATIENVLALHEEARLDLSVISSAGHYLRHFSREEAVPVIRESNECMASMRDKHKDRIVALATAIPGAGDGHLRELERAVKEDGLRGVLISSSHRGAYPDDDDARPFFALATTLDIPVFIHPPSVGFGEERMSDYRLASSIGRPFDNCLALARLIVRGIFEQFPGLKLVGSHLGGGICEVIGRMDYAYDLLDFSVFLGSYEPMLIKHSPSYYLKMMYFDSACYAAPAAECCLKTVGEDHFLFGTDSPPMVPLKKKGFDMMNKIGMTPTQYNKVMGGNAARLLKLN